MQRIRIRYTKRDRVRFVSARDLTSVWERALRRVDLPIAYSEGFTPHPKVSFPDALPVGYDSTGEYAELTFAAPIDPGPGLTALSATLPAGMDILSYWEVPDGAPKLARTLGATLWEVRYPAAADAVDVLRTLRELAAAAGTRDELTATRTKPGGEVKVVDVRPALLDLHASLDDAHPVLRAITRNDGPTVRPSDLHEALQRPATDDGDGASLLPDPRSYLRVVQGTPTDEGVEDALSGELEPLAPDRQPAGVA